MIRFVAAIGLSGMVLACAAMGVPGTAQAADPSWTVKASMPTPRGFASGGALGGSVYVCGGFTGSMDVATVEVYDPATNSWTTKAPLPQPLRVAAAGAIGGKLYIAGGHTPNNTISSTTYVYDPATNTWSTKAPMPTPRGDLASAVAGGKLYVVGGNLSVTVTSLSALVEIYDPVTDSWSTGASLPGPLSRCRGAAIGASVYVVGGSDTAQVDAVRAYDPATNTWTTRASLSTVRSSVDVATVGGRLYAIGGEGGYLTTVEEYDPVTNQWTARTAAPVAGGEKTVGVVNGRIYAVGGHPGTGAYTAANYEAAPDRLTSTVRAAPWPAAVGETVNVQWGVSNGLANPVEGVVPVLRFGSGAGCMTGLTGPSPAGPVTVSAGGTATFSWSFQVTGAGPISFTVSTSGTEAVTGTAVTTIDALGQPGSGTCSTVMPPAGTCDLSAPAWETGYNSPANNSDVPHGAAADHAGQFVIAGHTLRSDLGQGTDWLVRKYDSTGGLLWSRTHNHGGGNSDMASGVAIDQANNVIVGGTANFVSNGSGFLRTAKYGPEGQLLWSRTYNIPGVADDNYLQGVAVDPADASIAVVGYVDRADIGQGPNWIVLKYSAGGVLLWATEFHQSSQDQAVSVAIDASGHVIVGGWSDGTTVARVRKYSSSGALVWSQSIVTGTGAPAVVSGLTTDSSGNIYAVGKETVGGQSMNWFVQKLNPVGGIVWTRTHNGAFNGWDEAICVTIDAGGDIVVGGEETYAAGPTYRWLVRAYDSSGNLRWSRTMGSTSPGQDSVRAIAVLSSGPLVLAGADTVAGQDHNWRVMGFTCVGGSSPPPPPPPCTTCPTPPPPPAQEATLYVAPHPLKCPGGYATFEMKQAGTAHLRIVDMRGQVVKGISKDLMAAPSAQVWLDCLSVKNGAYFLNGELKYTDGTSVRLKPYKFVVAGGR